MGREAETAYITNSSQLYLLLLFVIIKHTAIIVWVIELLHIQLHWFLLFSCFVNKGRSTSGYCIPGRLSHCLPESCLRFSIQAKEIIHERVRQIQQKPHLPLDLCLSAGDMIQVIAGAEIVVIPYVWGIVMTISMVIMADFSCYPLHKKKKKITFFSYFDAQIHCLSVAGRLPLSKYHLSHWSMLSSSHKVN